ncbi:hypothetical protein DLAC_09629 [Tieghemostelium lacteum]|uniref:F-box domain-containing protein n=1 Tax=Tieghemostelium lacteum TaxID=361077 RepID=A0A151Z7A0_TIELA|nr:hypothetical protein DLAC_09629 [Tieghemostelium lacteum]|eukprot:KYQ89664.1 hypothetical protein DLAC_09629 [Tieghemostelium lacteum]
MLNLIPTIILQRILKFISKHDCFALTSTCVHINKLRYDFEFWKRVISFYGTYYYTIVCHNLTTFKTIQQARYTENPNEYTYQQREMLQWIKSQYTYRKYLDTTMMKKRFNTYLETNQDGNYERYSLNIQNRLKDITITVSCSIPFSSNIIVGGYETSNGSPYLQIYDFSRDIEVTDLIYRNYYRSFNFTKTEPYSIYSVTSGSNMIAFSNTFNNDISLLSLQGYRRVKNFTNPNILKANQMDSKNIKVKLSVDSQLLAVSSMDGIVNVYDVEYQKLVWSQCQPVMPVCDVSWQKRDNNLLFGCGEILNNNTGFHNNTGFVKCWDIRENQKQKVLAWTEYIECTGLSISNDSHYLGYVLRRGIGRSLDLRNRKLQSTLIPQSCKTMNFQNFSRNHARESVVWLPGNHGYLASTQDPRGINIWNSQDGKLISYINLGAFLKTTDYNRHPQLDITDNGLFLLCNLGALWSINDLSEISLFQK